MAAGGELYEKAKDSIEDIVNSSLPPPPFLDDNSLILGKFSHNQLAIAVKK